MIIFLVAGLMIRIISRHGKLIIRYRMVAGMASKTLRVPNRSHTT